jgi:hypothetical protein
MVTRITETSIIITAVPTVSKVLKQLPGFKPNIPRPLFGVGLELS